MQKLVLITGSPCVGKTAVANRLFECYENSAYFDGDWAWCVHPFSLSDSRLRNGDKTMSFALSVYLNSHFDYVFFSSVVLLDAAIRAAILSDITASGYEVVAFTLTCSEKTLIERHQKRGGVGQPSFHWLHLPPLPGDHLLDTEGKTISQTAAEMRKIIGGTAAK